MFNKKAIKTVKVFTAEEIAASGSAEYILDLNKYKPESGFSLFFQVTGDGACTLSYLCSNDGVNYLVPESIDTDIATGLTKTSGNSSNGKMLFAGTDTDFELCWKLKFKVTETGGANSVTINAVLAIQ